MRPVSVFANGPDSEIERLRAELRGPWRQAARAVMVLLSLHELPPAQIAGLLECHPGTARRWIARFNQAGLAGLADRPRCGRPRLGGRRLTRRIAALLARPGPWTLPRIRRCLGWPQLSPRTLYRRVRLVAIWRRPKLTARGDPYHDHVVAQIVARLIELPRRAVVLAEDETHLNLLPHVRASWTLRAEGDRYWLRAAEPERGGQRRFLAAVAGLGGEQAGVRPLPIWISATLPSPSRVSRSIRTRCLLSAAAAPVRLVPSRRCGHRRLRPVFHQQVHVARCVAGLAPDVL